MVLSLSLGAPGTGGVSVLSPLLGVDGQGDLPPAPVLRHQEGVGAGGEGGRQLKLTNGVQDKVIPIELNILLTILQGNTPALGLLDATILEHPPGEVLGGGHALYGHVVGLPVMTSDLQGHVDPLLVCSPLQHSGRELPCLVQVHPS